MVLARHKMRRGIDSQAMDIQLVYLSVLGKLRTAKTARPTTAHTMVQVDELVRVFMQMVQVNKWLPMTKTWKMTCAQPKTSWNTRPIPIDLPITSTASPKFCTKGYSLRNSAKTRPEYVERKLITRMRMIPGTRPTVARTEGSDRIPRETVSAIRTMPPCLRSRVSNDVQICCDSVQFSASTYHQVRVL